jgi:hypothetical protein
MGCVSALGLWVDATKRPCPATPLPSPPLPPQAHRCALCRLACGLLSLKGLHGRAQVGAQLPQVEGVLLDALAGDGRGWRGGAGGRGAAGEGVPCRGRGPGRRAVGWGKAAAAQRGFLASNSNAQRGGALIGMAKSNPRFGGDTPLLHPPPPGPHLQRDALVGVVHENAVQQVPKLRAHIRHRG